MPSTLVVVGVMTRIAGVRSRRCRSCAHQRGAEFLLWNGYIDGGFRCKCEARSRVDWIRSRSWIRGFGHVHELTVDAAMLLLWR